MTFIPAEVLLRWLAMGHRPERNAGGVAQDITVATLLVNPDDAEHLILASNQGRIQLILRAPIPRGRLTFVPVIMDSPMPCDERIKGTHDSADDMARMSGRC